MQSFKDALAMLVVLGAAGAELAVREHFHQLSAEEVRIAALLLALIVGAGVMLVARHLRERLRTWAGRIVVCAALAVSFSLVVWPELRAMLAAGSERGWWPWALGAAGLVLALLSLTLGERLWARCRLGLAAACVLFVGSQHVAAVGLAKPHAWPPAEQAAPAQSVLVYLLLDELNANAAEPFVEVFRRAGMHVESTPVQPVAHATAQVIPELFSGMPFDDAKPCGWTTVCSGRQALDFSLVRATRPDIDVVGFYMPYCAIRGLRSCRRLSPAPALTDLSRWRCGAARRLGLDDEAGRVRCAEGQSARWRNFVAAVEASIEQAPVWREGGMLFAHVPLPHPPGAVRGGTLAADYRANLRRAERLLQRMVDLALASGRTNITFVLFSDHPLRPALWCSHPFYAAAGCPVSPDLLDERVPVVVAGDARPDLRSLSTNRDVFALPLRWQARDASAGR